MSSSQTLKINCDRCDNAFVVISFKTMYNKTIIRFGFCDIRNNQGLGKCYQPQPSALIYICLITLSAPMGQVDIKSGNS